VELINEKYVKISNNAIHEDTCKLFEVMVGDIYEPFNEDNDTEEKEKGISFQYYNKYNTESVKRFMFKSGETFDTGFTGEVLLFGQNINNVNKDKIFICSDELDTLSVAQVLKNKYQTVSPFNTDDMIHDLKKNLEYIEKFDKIVLVLKEDTDIQIKKDMIDLFTPGKLLITKVENSANYMIKTGMKDNLIASLYEAQLVRPDGIVSFADLDVEDLYKPIEGGIEYPFEKLNEMTKGVRPGELVLFTAASGIGKSSILREIAYDFFMKGEKVAMVYLEEEVKKTAHGFIAIDNNVPLNELSIDPTILDKETFYDSYNRFKDSDSIHFYDHFGSLDSENLFNKLRFFRKSLGVSTVFLDHITIMTSGNATIDERKELDVIMTKLKSLAIETGLIIIAVVHIKRSSSSTNNQNEGGTVSLTDLRGSASLEQLSDSVIALERNQQSEDYNNISSIRVLKNRAMGILGKADYIEYDYETGRIEEMDDISLSNYLEDMKKYK